MNKKYIACPLCGHHYDPAENTTCQSCPLNTGCGFSCCPECGYEQIDISQSALVRLITAAVEKLPRKRFSDQPPALPGNGIEKALPKLLNLTVFAKEIKFNRIDRSTIKDERSNGNLALPYPLPEAPTGSEVYIRGFTSEISPKLRERLQAYGLTSGVKATIKQLSPVVILQVENLDLALEPQLALNIQVITA